MTAHARVSANSPKTATKPNAFLRRLATLVPLTMDDRLALARLTAQVRTVPAGLDLVRAGSRLNHAWIVLDGFACHYKLRRDGRRQNLSFLLPGDISDLDGVILERTNLPIGTLSQCIVVQVPSMALRDLVECHPSIAQALRLAKLADEAISREWIVQLGRYTATERMAHFFCELLVRLQAIGLVEDTDSYHLPLTQAELGEILGLTPVHVNRSLQILRGEGWITFAGSQLRILDLECLKRYAEFDAGYLCFDINKEGKIWRSISSTS